MYSVRIELFTYVRLIFPSMLAQLKADNSLGYLLCIIYAITATRANNLREICRLKESVVE